MIAARKTRIFYFSLFLLPAFLLYATFFIWPLLMGVQYSFTDWNGVVPEIPFNMSRSEFETKVIRQVKARAELAYLLKYYQKSADGQFYNLTHWIKENGRERQLTAAEREKIKAILAKVGISSIKQIGLANYQEMFQADTRFVPRFEKKFLFNEFDDLPTSIKRQHFNNDLLKHLSAREKALVLGSYQLNQGQNAYLLKEHLAESKAEELKTILAEQMYQTVYLPGVIGFTIFFMILNVLLSNFFALLLALLLDHKLRMQNFLRSIFFLPNVLSLVIVAFIWSFVFKLIMPAVTGIPLWLGSTDLAPYCVIIVSVWQACGYLMVIYLAGLQTIPTDVLEAAEIDGANWSTKFKHITWPLLAPALTICLFYSISNSLKAFEVPLALTSGGPGYATTPIVLDVYFNAFMQNRFGYGTAKAVLLCLIIILITGIQLTLMKRREVEL